MSAAAARADFVCFPVSVRPEPRSHGLIAARRIDVSLAVTMPPETAKCQAEAELEKKYSRNGGVNVKTTVTLLFKKKKGGRCADIFFVTFDFLTFVF